MYCDKHEQIFIEIDHTYRCMRTLKIMDELISEIKIMLIKQCYCGELKLYVTPSAHLLEDYIVYKMKNIMGGLADKSENYIKRAHQDGNCSDIIKCGLINFQQYQISQLKNNNMMTNSKVKLKSEQIKNESKRNKKR